MFSRRRTLVLLAGLSTAGCSTLLARSDPRARLDGVWLVNDRADPQDVRVTVTESSDPVFETTRRLGTFENPTPNDGNVLLDPGLGEPGRYAVSLSVEGEESTVDAGRVVDGSEDCVLVRFTLTRGSGVQPWMRSYRRCDGETAAP